MAIRKIHLKALLKLFSLQNNKLEAALRTDARNLVRKEGGVDSEGGDFHVPFWSDAKAHINGESDLQTQTEERIRSNKKRQRLYTLLTTKFLEWQGEKRRWTNEGIYLLPENIRGRHLVNEFDALIKVENILPLNVGSQATRYFYPYFSEKPPLSDEMARIGLWLMHKALPDIPAEQLRILDILRAKSYSLKKTPFLGDEEHLFLQRYRAMIEKWQRYYNEFSK